MVLTRNGGILQENMQVPPLFSGFGRKKAPFQIGKVLLFFSVSKLRLVADIRQQCNVSCTLDGSCQFTLMECTGAGDSAGQNLCTLSHALLELCNILIVDALYAIYTEHANLFAGALATALRSFSLHADISSYLQCGISFHALIRRELRRH